MSRVLLHRPARLTGQRLPTGGLALAPTPRVNRRAQTAGGWVTLALPLLSSLTMAGYMISYGRPVLIALGIAFVVLSVFATLALRYQMTKTQRQDRQLARDKYLAHVSDVRRQARDIARTQNRVALQTHPGPHRLLELVADRRRVWERRREDADFLKVRVGFGDGTLGTPVAVPGRGDPMAEHDDVAAAAAEALLDATSTLPLAPAWLDLARSGVVSVLAEPGVGRSIARSLLCQLTALQGPADVRVAVAAGSSRPEDLAEWEWAGWLPHTRPPGASEAGVPMVGADLRDLEDSLLGLLADAQQEADAPGTPLGLGLAAVGSLAGAQQAQRRHLVVVLDRFDPHAEWARRALLPSLLAAAGPGLGVHVVCLVARRTDEPSRVDVRAVVDDAGVLHLESPDPTLVADVADADPDDVPVELAELLARRLAPLVQDGEQPSALTGSVHLLDVLGVDDAERFEPSQRWVRPGSPDMLRVPLGVDADGDVVTLDLKESAQGGMGPHGLVVGATGSGKSELLRTLVTGLTTTHSPDLLSLVLIDFKGGATFAGVTELPHVAGLITNLADDLAMVERMRAALQGEQQRRQQLLRQAGDLDSVREYQMRHAAGMTDREGRPLEPLPDLVVIVDEFGELLAQRPDFTELFLQIGRVGRSLGIHLLLASQRLEEGRLRGLDSHLSYRLALRTFSAAESRTVLGTPDAYRLPAQPGAAYLKVDESVYTRFQVAHVSAPYVPDRRAAEAAVRVSPWRLVRCGGDSVQDAAPEPEPTPQVEAADLARPTVMAVLTRRCLTAGRPVHQVWLPPLPEAIPLDAVTGSLMTSADRGLHIRGSRGGTRVGGPVGVIDLPVEQRQHIWSIEVERTAHWALVGAPQTGKSTALFTFLTGLALSHTPAELQFTGIDLGGGGLEALERLPHCSGIAGRHQPDRARRVLAEVRTRIQQREALYRREGIVSSADARSRRAAGAVTDLDDLADLVLVIDNWGAARAELAGVDELVQDITTRGPGVGVHLLLTANRWADIRANLRDTIDGRAEFRLNDPTESEVHRQQARLAPAVPGRLLTAGGRWVQVVLPRVDGRIDADTLAAARNLLLQRIDEAWSGHRAPAVRMLPDRIALAEQPAELALAAPGVPVGIGEDAMAVVRLDLAGAEQHLVVVGDAASGKSSALRTVVRGIVARDDPADVKLMVLDPRRSLLGAVADDHLSAYAGDRQAAEHYVRQLCTELDRRLPPSTLSADELAARSWWEGPELYLVVDDLDLWEGATSPVTPVLGYLAHARDIGLHVVLARRSAGISRSAFGDGLLARLRDAAAPFLLLSGDPREGVVAHQQKLAELPVGRAVLASRSGAAQRVQVFDPDPRTTGVPG